MATDMIKSKLLHWCFKSLRVLTMVMKAPVWSSTSTQNLAKLSRRTSVVIPRVPKPQQHLKGVWKKSCSTSAKNAIKAINFGSRGRVVRSIGPSSSLPNNADRPRQQRTMEQQKFKSLRSLSLTKFHPVSPARLARAPSALTLHVLSEGIMKKEKHLPALQIKHKSRQNVRVRLINHQLSKRPKPKRKKNWKKGKAQNDTKC